MAFYSVPYSSFPPIKLQVIVRYSTDIESAGIMYTDSNGREMQKACTNIALFVVPMCGAAIRNAEGATLALKAIHS
jgi:F420-0:gamma-glutamyl ligase